MKKYKSSERGIAHVLIIVVAVVVVAAGGVGYYVYHKNHKSTYSPSSTSSTGTGTQSTTTTAADSSCNSTYHDATLCKFASNSTNFDKTAYTATITGTDSSGNSINFTLSNDGKGNTSLVTTSGGQQLSSITLNGNTYIQTGAGTTWIEYSSGATGASSATTNPASSMNIGVGSSGITYKAEGTEACGDLTCYKYAVTDSSQPGVTQYAWFDNSTYQLRKWESTGGSSGNITMTITYKSVNITAPSPVQSYGA